MKASVALLALVATLAFVPTTYAAPAEDQPSAAAVDTQLALRDLWVEHVFWVRNYVVANAQNQQAAADTASEQVVANAGAIANSIAPLYGQPAADALLGLLAGHWGAIKQYSDATVAGDESQQESAVSDLTGNAGEIADFLAGANPYLPRDTLFSLLGAHGSHHVAQIQQIAAGDYATEAQTWQAMRTHIQAISDALTAALVKQFPDKF
ncbi:MAG TPA: hypothetical protein VNR18_02655 [Hyphomicrobiales bacterium]|nr:hypothetical protein [Hyphomicrobiales bacterium]